MSVKLWSITITAELDDNGCVDTEFALDGEVSVGELVGYIEVVQQQIIQGALEDEGEFDEN